MPAIHARLHRLDASVERPVIVPVSGAGAPARYQLAPVQPIDVLAKAASGNVVKTDRPATPAIAITPGDM
jgi:hypothetical protein